MKRPCVYILTNKPGGLLYVGVTSDPARRIWDHKSNIVGGFTKKYNLHTLVYAEFHDTMPDAILREKKIKRWRRAWKIKLIEQQNDQWADLYNALLR